MKRRLIAAAVTLVLLAALGLYFFLASIPARFGRQVGAGYASVEQSLCALDRDGSAGILVAGDSRARSQVVPAMLADATGLRCVNVGEDLNLGGDLATLVNTLRRHPEALASRPILLISVSVDGINDLSFADAPMAALVDFTPAEHFRLALRKPLGYPLFFAGTFLPFLRREARHMKNGDGFVCGDSPYYPAAGLASLGYRPYPTLKRPQNPSRRRPGFILDGGRRRIFLASLDWLSQSGARAVVLYNAPVDKAWLGETAGQEAVNAEEKFSAFVSAETPLRAKTFFWNFAAAPFPGLSRERFYDPDHLNGPGARIFSAELARRLAREFPPGKNP